MAAVLEAALAGASTKLKRCLPAAMVKYQFQPGHKRIEGSGRAPGTPNASTIYLNSLPLKARQWVKSDAPQVLIDARKIALPIDSDAGSSPSLSAGPVVIVFLNDGQAMPMIPVAADDSASKMLRLDVPKPDYQTIRSVDN
mgnify:CR=1 FL=1